MDTIHSFDAAADRAVSVDTYFSSAQGQIAGDLDLCTLEHEFESGGGKGEVADLFCTGNSHLGEGAVSCHIIERSKSVDSVEAAIGDLFAVSGTGPCGVDHDIGFGVSSADDVEVIGDLNGGVVAIDHGNVSEVLQSQIGRAGVIQNPDQIGGGTGGIDGDGTGVAQIGKADGGVKIHAEITG